MPVVISAKHFDEVGILTSVTQRTPDDTSVVKMIYEPYQAGVRLVSEYQGLNDKSVDDPMISDILMGQKSSMTMTQIGCDPLTTTSYFDGEEMTTTDIGESVLKYPIKSSFKADA